MKNKIKFSYNWNNKLNCNVFTTFRIKNEKYQVRNIYEIYLKEKYLFDAEIVSIKELKLDEVDDYISYLDTGYSVNEFKKIMKKMYREKVDCLTFYLILLKKKGEKLKNE